MRDLYLFGSYWSDNERSFPRYRVEWDADTGELFATNHRTGTTETFCRIADKVRVHSLMHNWFEQMFKPESLDWIRRRCSERADQLAGLSGGDARTGTP